MSYPSRDRYEKNNPTVSARVSIATREKLYANLEALGMTLSEALKVLAGELEVKAKSVIEIQEQALQIGFQRAKKR